MLRWLSQWAMRLLFGIVERFPDVYTRSMTRAAEQAAARPAPPGAVLLVGSSKIRLWSGMQERHS